MLTHFNRLLAFKPAQVELVSLGLSAAETGLADSISGPLGPCCAPLVLTIGVMFKGAQV